MAEVKKDLYLHGAYGKVGKEIKRGVIEDDDDFPESGQTAGDTAVLGVGRLGYMKLGKGS